MTLFFSLNFPFGFLAMTTPSISLTISHTFTSSLLVAELLPEDWIITTKKNGTGL